MTQDGESSAASVSTDDLERELRLRKDRKTPTKRTTWTAIAGLLTALAGMVPSINGYIEAKTAKTRAEATTKKGIEGELSAEKHFKEVQRAVNQHAEMLLACRKDLDDLLAWRSELRERFHRGSLVVPRDVATSTAGISVKKVTLSKVRPSPAKVQRVYDERVQQAK